MLGAWLRRLAALFTRRRLDAELDEEIRFHLEMATEEYVRRGMSPEDARRAAQKSFGGIEQVRVRHREARGLSLVDDALRDLQLAARTLRKDRAFAVTVILTLSVAIGASAAAFSVVDAVLLRPLPYPDASEIVTVGMARSDVAGAPRPFSDAGYELLRQESRSFQELGAYRTANRTLTGAGEPMQASVGLMTNSAFSVLGVLPDRGRPPSPEEDLPGGPPIAILSHALWSARFQSDPSVIGSTIQLNDTTRTVIAVMPKGFTFPGEPTDIWIPLQMDPASEDPALKHYAIGRLRPDATPQAAVEDSRHIIQDIIAAGPSYLSSRVADRADIATLKERIVGDSRQLVLLVMAAMVFVLIIAFANVAGLFMVRAESLARQSVLRAALGASRRRLAQSALSESFVLAVASGLAGLGVAYLGVRSLVGIAPPTLPRLDGVGVSLPVVAYATLVSLIAGLVLGLLPMRGMQQSSRMASLLSGNRSTTERERLHLRGLLVVGQIALAVALTIGSGLIVRSYQELRAVDIGFEPEDVLTFGLVLPATRYDNAGAVELYNGLVERLNQVPDIRSAAATTGLPVTAVGAFYRLQIEGMPDSADAFDIRWVTPGYFETMEIPILGGRTMLPEDSGSFRFLVSKSFAERYWPGESPIGRRMGPGFEMAPIVGVVGDVHIHALNAPAEEAAYVPMGAPGSPSVLSVKVAVRTRNRGADLARLLRREVHALDPTIPIIDLQSMDELVGGSPAMSRTSFAMTLMVMAALLALLLGALGVYGVVTYVVSRRVPEIGIRIALGAKSGDIWSHVAGRSLMPPLIGVGLGLATAAAGSGLLTSFLFQVSPREVSVFVTAPVVFLAVAMIACVFPAKRAVEVDPVDALRSE